MDILANTSAIYEEKHEESLENCIECFSRNNLEKRYIDIERDYLSRFFSAVISNKNNFYKLDEETRERIIKLAKFLSPKYNKEHLDDNYYYNFLYTMFTIKGDKSLCIISNDGKLALFIETIDPELKMYDYYTDSKSIEEAKKKITDEFGFYDERLCYVEKYYKERFKKEKKLEYMTK